MERAILGFLENSFCQASLEPPRGAPAGGQFAKFLKNRLSRTSVKRCGKSVALAAPCCGSYALSWLGGVSRCSRLPGRCSWCWGRWQASWPWCGGSWRAFWRKSQDCAALSSPTSRHGQLPKRRGGTGKENAATKRQRASPSPAVSAGAKAGLGSWHCTSAVCGSAGGASRNSFVQNLAGLRVG